MSYLLITSKGIHSYIHMATYGRNVVHVLSIPPPNLYGAHICVFLFSYMCVKYVTSEQIYHIDGNYIALLNG